MASKEQTTVNLTEKAQVIKEDLAPVFGLKNILSAGLLLFGNLDSDEQKSKIAEANTNEQPRTEVMVIYNGEIEEILNNPDWEQRIRILRETKQTDSTLFPSEKRLMLAHLDYILELPKQAKAIHEACKKLPPMRAPYKVRKASRKQNSAGKPSKSR